MIFQSPRIHMLPVVPVVWLMLSLPGARLLAAEQNLPSLEQGAEPVPAPSAAQPARPDGAHQVVPFTVQEAEAAPLPVPAERAPGRETDTSELEKELENPLFKKDQSGGEEEIQTKPIDRAAIRALSAKYLMPEPMVGPFGLGGVFTGFRSGLVFTGMYDSNVLQAAPAVSEELYGRPPESFLLAAGPFARYRSPGPLWYLELDYSPTYIDYLDFPEFNGWDQNAQGELRYEHRDWQVELGGYYRTTRGISSSLSNNSRQQATGGAVTTTSGSLDREGLGGEDYGGSLRLSYDGRKLKSMVSGGYGRSSGQNRYYGSSQIDEELANVGLLARYQISPKTTLNLDGSMAYRAPIVDEAALEDAQAQTTTVVQPVVTPTPATPTDPSQPVPAGVPVVTTTVLSEEGAPEEPEDPRYAETINARLQLGMLWKATPLFELGPGVRCTYDARGSDLSSTGIGPMLRGRYQLSRRVAINAQVAAEFYQFDSAPPPPADPVVITQTVLTTTTVQDPLNPSAPPTTTSVVSQREIVRESTEEPVVYDEGENPFISAELGATWSPTERWTLSLIGSRSSRVSPNGAEDFQEVLAARAVLSRKFDYLVITAGAGYENQQPLREQVGGTPVSGGQDRSYLTADLSVSFPIWKDRAFATTFCRYRDQQSGNEQNTWDGYQAGIAIGVSF